MCGRIGNHSERGDRGTDHVGVIKELGHPGERPTGIDVLTAEQVYLASQLSLRIAEATRYADVVALYQALGGGWWNRSDVAGAGP
jgi:hypothetical protein